MVAAQVAAQAAALEHLREKLESGEPPEKKLALGPEEQQRLVQRAIQQNLLAMTSQFPMNIRINSQGNLLRPDTTIGDPAVRDEYSHTRSYGHSQY